MKDLLVQKKSSLLTILWESDESIYHILHSSEDLQDAREKTFGYLNRLERHYFNIYSDSHFKDMHILERNNAKQCIRVLKNFIRSENEHLTGTSCLKHIYNLARRPKTALTKVSEGFICEMIALFRGINGKSGISNRKITSNPLASKKDYIHGRMKDLDLYAETIRKHFKRYPSGLEKDLVKEQTVMRARILKHFQSNERMWRSFNWQMSHIIKDLDTLMSLVHLERDEIEGLKLAKEHGIPFQITPHYLSLFNYKGRCHWDRAVRAQVIPSARYCSTVGKNKADNVDMDFMQEHWTSPVNGITRRYPLILIIKPFDSCPQICVYCQRNWEIKKLKDAKTSKTDVDKAIKWISDNENITEVLVTGGDPLTLSNKYIDKLLGKLSRIEHVERIRIGTRVPITLPFRIDRGLLKILKNYHEWGRREVCIVTHFEHPAEVTPDSVKVISDLRALGLNVYNQQVFTYFNSRKFETCQLRRILKLSGVNPYYTFLTKGKDETRDFRVPMARIEQEFAEEARLMPGIVRTDEPVFNVPRLGKSYLKAWQDHEPIMIMPNGCRVYRFYPWEAKLTISDDYIYTDVSIYDYLKRLRSDHEDTSLYSSIWYYF